MLRWGLSPAKDPASYQFHPLTQTSQVHGDSGESMSRTLLRGRNPGEALAAPPAREHHHQQAPPNLMPPSAGQSRRG